MWGWARESNNLVIRVYVRLFGAAVWVYIRIAAQLLLLDICGNQFEPLYVRTAINLKTALLYTRKYVQPVRSHLGPVRALALSPVRATLSRGMIATSTTK